MVRIRRLRGDLARARTAKLEVSNRTGAVARAYLGAGDN
jgi:hypothetical protein